MTRPSTPPQPLGPIVAAYHAFNQIHARLLWTRDPEERRRLRAQMDALRAQLQGQKEQQL